MFSHWAYVLVGGDRTGKTSFQRNLVFHLCGLRYTRLRRNIVTDITHPRSPKGLRKLFTCNRSFQEKESEYRTVDYYFKHFFKDADICVLASHASGDSPQQIAEMIQNLRRRCYNVAGVFWSNSFEPRVEEICLLPWSELLWIENPILNSEARIDAQIEEIALRFSEFLVTRAYIQ